MLVRQLFDLDSSTYTYLLADEVSREAVLIDTVLEKVDDYERLLNELNLTLVGTLETHTHADHVTAAGDLRARLNCAAQVGIQSEAACASAQFQQGSVIKFGKESLKVLYTPGHTNDSYCFLYEGERAMVFTGDTLLIRGTGRCDFQNGDALAQYESLQTLLALDERTLVYPGHDYKGWTCSTIGEEKHSNPRLQFTSAQDYATFMNDLNLPNPKLMDIAVDANKSCGQISIGK
jgi:glyoxylase-like metal-dependent hydrolase (beta-lactamase superfamily II)